MYVFSNACYLSYPCIHIHGAYVVCTVSSYQFPCRRTDLLRSCNLRSKLVVMVGLGTWDLVIHPVPGLSLSPNTHHRCITTITTSGSVSTKYTTTPPHQPTPQIITGRWIHCGFHLLSSLPPAKNPILSSVLSLPI